MKPIVPTLIALIYICSPNAAKAFDPGRSPAQNATPCAIADLHPTQMAVGMIEVNDKLGKIRKLSGPELEKYLSDHPEPVVIGPGGHVYIIDHHHLAIALYEAGISRTYCVTLKDLSGENEQDFWQTMAGMNWVYPYDENGGGPQPYSALPPNVWSLKDDPYRSLAWGVREAKGYDKTDKPFSEFIWADFFRSRIDKRDITDNFAGTVNAAVKIARSTEAAGLPGYSGPAVPVREPFRSFQVRPDLVSEPK